MASLFLEDHISYGDSPYGLEDLDLIGDHLFAIGVPKSYPASFKQYVFAAAKTHNSGNRSVDHMLRTYRNHWKFDEEEDSETTLVWNMTSAAKRETRVALDRYRAIEKPDRLGLIAASAALVRLQTTLRLAILAIRQGFHFESALLMRLFLEQLAWAYAIHRTNDDSIFRINPARCISRLKEPLALSGRLYGILSEGAHITPERTLRYVKVIRGELTIFLTLQEWRRYDAYHLLHVADMYIVLTELLVTDLLPVHHHVERVGGGP